MGWLTKLGMRLRALRRGDEVHREIAEEWQFHIVLRTEENIRRGMTPEEARKSAEQHFGNSTQIKDVSWDVRGGGFVEALWQDMRYGVRMLRKFPGFTVVAVLTLALGIGANTAIFTIVNAVLLRPLPYMQPDQLVDLNLKTEQSSQTFVPYPIFFYWQRESHTLTAMGAWTHDTFNLTGTGMATRLGGRRVSANFFSLFGVRPILGRNFSPEDDRLGAATVVLVSEGFWRDRLGASPSAVGKTLTLDGGHYTIIGVIPSTFQFWSAAEIYVPIGQSENPSFDNDGPSRVLQIIGRLAPGVTLSQARAEMNVIDRNRVVAHPESADTATGITIHSLRQDVIGDLEPTLLLLLGAVGFVLLIGCANVATLLLARSTARTREFAIRTALGAGRNRVIRQLLTESLLLFAIGGTFGAALAGLVTHSALTILPTALPQMLRVSPDFHVLVFAVAISGLTGVLFGLIPAMRTSLPKLQETLKKGGQGIAAGRHVAQTVLIVGEISLALVLLTGAGLMIRSMNRIWSVNPGFDSHNLMFFTVGFPPPSNPDATTIRVRDGELGAKLAALPGVESVSVCLGALPMSGEWTITPYWPPNQPRPANPGENAAEMYAVGADYFRAMKLGLLQGRAFDKQDIHSAPNVIIIDEHLARHLFANENPVGKHLTVGFLGVAEIVGEVKHVKHFGLDADSEAQIQEQIYLPFSQLPDLFAPRLANQATYILRTSVPPVTLVDAIRYAVSETDSQRIVYDVQIMDEVLANSQSERRFAMALLAAFAAIALVLATVGIYGVISSLAAQRTGEIGIRMALGARPWDILRLVVGQGGKMALAGIAVGIIASFGFTRLIANLLFGVRSYDPATFASVAILLALVSVAACYIPARRAMRVDPMVALRHE
ncbi:MAG: ABC transporter permease [Candidatus Acidiferrum sp.]